MNAVLQKSKAELLIKERSQVQQKQRKYREVGTETNVHDHIGNMVII
jgi:hypothetical protein